MKNISWLTACCITLSIVSVAFWAKGAGARSSPLDASFDLKVSADKPAYLPGEVVNLAFELANKGNDPVALRRNPNVATGYLKIWISSDGSEYCLYNNSSWGLLDGRDITIRSREVIRSSATILWNNKPQIPRTGEGKLLTDFAFPKPGSYFLKAVAILQRSGDNGTVKTVESKPIPITIREPFGDDAKVWNLIKDNGDIAYFIQQTDTPSYNDDKAQGLLQEVERIATSFPESFLAKQMKEKLVRYRLNDAKRTLRLENAKVKPANVD